MVISGTPSLIFIHIPKCAGSSVERAFDCTVGDTDYETMTGRDPNKSESNYWLQHATLHELQDEYGFAINEYITFAVVRNPWDRFISSYAYECKYFGCKMDYKQFAVNMPHINRQHKYTQLSYLKDKDGNVNMDYILRFETLQGDFDSMMHELGLPTIKLGFYNKVNHRHYTECYDDELYNLVCDIYKEDVDYLNYKYK